MEVKRYPKYIQDNDIVYISREILEYNRKSFHDSGLKLSDMDVEEAFGIK